MSQRLYYDDPYLTTFAAQVVERLPWAGQPAVVLDRTAFYPTGGGQPHDVGRLQGVGARQGRGGLGAPLRPHAATHGPAHPVGGLCRVPGG